MSSLIKWEPFSEFDRFFNDTLPVSRLSVGWDMAVDVYEDGNTIVAEMNLPGMDAGTIDVSVEDGYLHVSGLREEKKEKNYWTKEIQRGSFERVVRIPAQVDDGKVSAEYKGGVLKVVMPKTKTKKKRLVEVKARDN